MDTVFVTIASVHGPSSLGKPRQWSNSTTCSKQIHFIPLYHYYNRLTRVLDLVADKSKMEGKLKYSCYFRRLEAGTGIMRSTDLATFNKTRAYRYTFIPSFADV